MSERLNGGGRDGGRFRQAAPKLMLGHGNGLESFTDEGQRRARARELHRAGQVTAEWAEPQLEIVVQLDDGLASCAWDCRGDARDTVRALFPDALGFQFADVDGDWIIGDWMAVA